MQRIPALDGLRTISILFVLSAHLLPLGPKFFGLNSSAGAMGMSLFFALSGFLITSNLIEGQGVYSFFVRRLMRILPLAYLYLTVVFLFLSFEPTMLLGNLLFIENYFHSILNGWNAHFWSLCVEVHFYAAIGITVALLGKRGIWAVLPACFAITILRISFGALIDIRTHLRVDEILAGATVAILYHNKLLRFRFSNRWLVATVIFWFLASSEVTGPLQYLRPYSSAALLAVVVGLKPGLAILLLNSSPARYIAGISYALYVIHPATVHGWMNEGTTFERYAFKRPLSLALTFLLAHVSKVYWESKWIAWGKTLTARKTAPA
jgi:peptidoglycan/LPS O-acetylase OafA/YrhL